MDLLKGAMSFVSEHKGEIQSIFQAVAKGSSKGEMYVSTNKTYYVQGEVVSGQIYMTIRETVQASDLIMTFQGYEKAEWNQIKTRNVDRGRRNEQGQIIYDQEKYIERHRTRNNFIADRKKIYSFNGGVLLPGSYMFPFAYQLPENLPGSFYERTELEKNHMITHFEDNQDDVRDFVDSDDESASRARGHRSYNYDRPQYEALVMYKLKVLLDVNGFLSSDIVTRFPIIVHERIDDIKPVEVSNSGQVMLCCCIPRGLVTVTANFDKNAYVPGETANIRAVIKNDSKSKVHMAVKLMRFLTIRSRRDTLNLTETVSREDYGDIAPGVCDEKHMPLPLMNTKIVPSTKGQVISCSYRYDVECQVSCARDVEAQLPCVIYAPQPPPLMVPVWVQQGNFTPTQ